MHVRIGAPLGYLLPHNLAGKGLGKHLVTTGALWNLHRCCLVNTRVPQAVSLILITKEKTAKVSNYKDVTMELRASGYLHRSEKLGWSASGLET